jgi:small subunit ribosomal protein S20
MANTISALKRMRQSQRRTAVNRARKTRFRSQVKALRRALEGKDAAAAQALLPKTFSLMDRAVKWGVITKNTAARYKSRLVARLRVLESPAA